MLMNGGAGVNYGNALRGNRKTAQPSPAEELDVGNVDVDALLADSAHQDRAWTQKLQGLQAQQALNALQKWMFEHDSLNDDRERWRRAHNVMSKLASNCDALPQQLSIDWVGFTENDLMARGAFAIVYKGVDRNRRPVAVKRLHLGELNDRDGADLHRRFKREALIWFQLKHPNILPLQGIFQQNANFAFYPCMISPWVDGGTIFQYIKSDAHDPQQQRVPLLKDVAKGLDYVHERGVSHGDLHDGNILIHQGHAVLTDFGMAVVGDKSNSRIPTTQIPANAIRWLAPELITEEDYTPRKTSEGDIFAFGRLCLAICTRGVIYADMPETAVILNVSMGTMPARPIDQACYGVPMSDQLWNLAVACWNLDKSARPSAAQALERL